MNDDITKTSTVDIIKEMTRLDHEIDLLMLKHEKLRLEMIRRFPYLEKDDLFKQKKKTYVNNCVKEGKR